MTFSVMGYDPVNGDVGAVVSTNVLAVGSRVPNAEAGVGGVCTQATTNASLGPMLMGMLRAGMAPQQALDAALATDNGRDQRQVMVVDTRGRIAAWTGLNNKVYRGHRIAENMVAFGNIIVGEEVLTEAVRAYAETRGELRDRLMAAYKAGQDAGGDATGVQSAVLKISRINAYPFIDLRVDNHASPIDELHRLVTISEQTLAPRLPQLVLQTPPSAAAGTPVELRVTDGERPVAAIAITANGRYCGMTDGDGRLATMLPGPGDYYLAAAQPPTSTLAAATYQYAPAVRWLQVAG
jgi:uncharacterized Ntn-hydrolase superfamily protein